MTELALSRLTQLHFHHLTSILVMLVFLSHLDLHLRLIAVVNGHRMSNTSASPLLTQKHVDRDYVLCQSSSNRVT
jgi:hypothetical protein